MTYVNKKMMNRAPTSCLCYKTDTKSQVTLWPCLCFFSVFIFPISFYNLRFDFSKIQREADAWLDFKECFLLRRIFGNNMQLRRGIAGQKQPECTKLLLHF